MSDQYYVHMAAADRTRTPIRVLVVEDSPSARELLVRILQADDRFAVVGTAEDGERAVQMAAEARPDVITMDIHLPRLDGIEATQRIMAETPTPIVVISSRAAEQETRLAFAAVQAGALAVLAKPPGPGHPHFAAAVEELLTTIRLMSEVKVVRRRLQARPDMPAAATTVPNERSTRPQLIAIAASTGGPQAIQSLLQTLGHGLDVPLIAVQHMSEGFIGGMAHWLSATCPLAVRVATHGEPLRGDTVYLAPDEYHLLVSRRGTTVLSKAPPQGGFRPSANVMFEAVAEAYGPRAVGVILTGMGEDGAAGLAAMRALGATTLAQDEATSVVYGMPRAAVATGAAAQVLPLTAIGSELRRLLGLHALAAGRNAAE